MKSIRAVTFIIIRPDGKILMQLRDDGKGQEIPYPNMWCLPGGGIEAGESGLDAVIREVKEEFNLDISASDCKFIQTYFHDKNIEDQIFVCRVSQDTKVELNEGADMKWMTFDEIMELDLAWEFSPIMSEIIKKIQN